MSTQLHSVRYANDVNIADITIPQLQYNQTTQGQIASMQSRWLRCATPLQSYIVSLRLSMCMEPVAQHYACRPEVVCLYISSTKVELVAKMLFAHEDTCFFVCSRPMTTASSVVAP